MECDMLTVLSVVTLQVGQPYIIQPYYTAIHYCLEVGPAVSQCFCGPGDQEIGHFTDNWRIQIESGKEDITSESFSFLCDVYIWRIQETFNQTLSILLGIQFMQCNGQIKDRKLTFLVLFLIFLPWHDPQTKGVQELILSLFKVHSWLTYEWKSVRFWWYFHSFHENAEGVLLKIRP